MSLSEIPRIGLIRKTRLIRAHSVCLEYSSVIITLLTSLQNNSALTGDNERMRNRLSHSEQHARRPSQDSSDPMDIASDVPTSSATNAHRTTCKVLQMRETIFQSPCMRAMARLISRPHQTPNPTFLLPLCAPLLVLRAKKLKTTVPFQILQLTIRPRRLERAWLSSK